MFSEDEDEILFDQPDDHDQNLDVHPLQQQHHHTHVPYNPPQHFKLYEEYNQTPHQDFQTHLTTTECCMTTLSTMSVH